MDKNRVIRKILWVDDALDGGALDSEIDELTDQGFVVVQALNPDEAIRILNQYKDFVCIVIDVIMPFGNVFTFGDTQNGNLTGFALLKKFADINIPKVVYTNVLDESVQAYCAIKNIPYWEKEDFTSDAFVESIKNYLGITND